MDSLAAWPLYPHPYNSFSFSFSNYDSAEMDCLFGKRNCDENRISLVADHSATEAIGYLSLIRINWQRSGCGNMGIRVHPEYCGKGIGTAMLAAVSEWWFSSGMNKLCLDVASSNRRAIRCHEKAGFTRYGEFWKAMDDLKGVNFADQQWHFLKGHVRNESQIPDLKFLLMELGWNRNKYEK